MASCSSCTDECNQSAWNILYESIIMCEYCQPVLGCRCSSPCENTWSSCGKKTQNSIISACMCKKRIWVHLIKTHSWSEKYSYLQMHLHQYFRSFYTITTSTNITLTTHAGEYYLCIPSSWEQIQWFFVREEFWGHIRTHWVQKGKKENAEKKHFFTVSSMHPSKLLSNEYCTYFCGLVWLKGSGWFLLYFSVTISSKRL